LYGIVQQTAKDVGRDPADVELCTSPVRGLEHAREDVAAMIELGARRIIIPAYPFFSANPAKVLVDLMEQLP